MGCSADMEQQWKKKWFVLRATKLAYYKDNRVGRIHSV